MSRPSVPLSRNRDYHILWGSQLLSELAAEITQIAFPLLILAMAGSPLAMGLASSVLMAANMVAVVPAGVAADRWNRKRIMVVCMLGRALAMGALALAVLGGAGHLAAVLAVAAVEGFLGAVFDPVEHAALPQVVPADQLARAVARNAARPFVATLLGPAVAGFLFTAHPATPLVADAVMLGLSFVALLFLRLPHRVTPADAPPTRVRADVAEGFRWVLGHRTLRATMLWMVFCNLVLGALVTIVLAVSGETGVDTGEIGLTMACLGAGGLLGGMAADRLRAALPAPVVLVGFSWLATALVAAMSLVPAGVLLGVLLGAVMFCVPVANTTVLTYQLVTTPDRLRGRLSSLAGFCSGGAGALGPLFGGLLAAAGGTTGTLVCAAALGLVALGVSLSPTMRRFPSATLAPETLDETAGARG
ncbi:putative arabinose efflux permease, MFS family [Streptoalloteichus tenebrarius]|uniref:Arabinose efflux permease, MFS family n=1 Tax=Streptoalloteichus tenebrarius (strain ATCC 17920 / DSM 40477 / JCM 4838 / CBS 697.72 / NBRC 16177 / NCIMB 11028 / NRRL B-12390 / A12253. 1 / ISP 5477) TaxID=1933 RepID=A0ABT1HLP6_STRSD|nr:MFS transporter [Streptoalloteichus tenebrarius]MCP2256432.1 putative arabinose efflux permease, MFS family [Streptoalloteichus tenebrarius]BFF04784.1 MFS transporter [Streptoalloteichus tenebrarius]